MFFSVNEESASSPATRSYFCTTTVKGYFNMKKVLFTKAAGSLLLTAGLLASGAASAQTTLTFNADGNADFSAAHAWSAMH